MNILKRIVMSLPIITCFFLFCGLAVDTSYSAEKKGVGLSPKGTITEIYRFNDSSKGTAVQPKAGAEPRVLDGTPIKGGLIAQDKAMQPTARPTDVKRAVTPKRAVLLSPFGTPKMLSISEIEEYITQLKQGSVEKKREAIEALNNPGLNKIQGEPLGDELLSLVLQEFKSSNDTDTRKSAAGILGRLGGEGASSVLINEVRSGDDEEAQASAIEALGNLYAIDAVDIIIDRLQYSDNDNLRRASARALGKLDDERAVYPLIRVLDDNNYDLKREAIVSLGQIGGDEAKIALRRILDNGEDLKFREIAARALRSMGAE